MADEQYHWLDGDAAERLLRGEPLDAVDDHARVQAERLSAVLGDARRAHPSQQPEGARGPHPHDGELPGEAAALAAFRDARGAYATRVDDAPGAWVLGGRPGPGDTAGVLGDSGAVRMGTGDGKPRTRWGRPLRYGLAAALAACTLGGVAMAGAGVIPMPFDRGPEPGPGASVSAAPSDADPLVSPSPSTSASDPDGGHSGSATPDGATEGAPGSGHPSHGGASSDPGGTAPKPTDSALPKDEQARWYARVVTGCRDYLAGKPMDAEKKRRIEESAGGPEGVRKFCRKVLSDDGGSTDQRSGDSGEDGGGNGDSGADRGSEDGGDGADGGNRHEGNGGTGAIVSPSSAAPTSTAPTSATPTVSATTKAATDSVSTAGADGTGNP
ncbi:hypothetical protein RCO28_17135 [Streptomyces sp. LHD-70]|uniref:hypothetical protein n=1 Tax=Streptomyces sp. LHD-70 TaxID=3072140 RepID=UPI0028103903|nr:hypothetical protein [Streptomyces sp. LHD-70]MDQ8704198.1 hypothetical protein [Streptomyces sp. LHD-70]